MRNILLGCFATSVIAVIVGCSPAHQESSTSSITSSITTSVSTPAWPNAEDLDPATYQDISARDYALLMKDPNAAQGSKIVVWGVVTQFDTSTGKNAFRASTDGVPHSRDSFDYPYNTIVVTADPRIVADVVEGDVVKMGVVVDGTYTYQAPLGQATVPKLRMNVLIGIAKKR